MPGLGLEVRQMCDPATACLIAAAVGIVKAVTASNDRNNCDD